MMDKLKGIEAGNRVRVTFEFVVTSCGKEFFDGITDNDNRIGFGNDTVNDRSFQIETIARRLKIGDLVRGKGLYDDWEVIAVRGQKIVIYCRDAVRLVSSADLERIP